MACNSTLVEEFTSTVVVANVQQSLYVRCMSLGERIKLAIDARGIKQADLARATGIDEATISALIKRESTRSAAAPKLAKGLGVSLQWLMSGEGPSGLDELRAEQNVEEYHTRGSRLPLISWVSAGLKDDANDPYAPGNAEEWIDFDSEASSSAFCLRVRGDSMVQPGGSEPSFPDGCIIGVEPRRRPKSREFAVFRFNDTDEATFKQYVKDGPLQLLKPLNPAYPTIALGPDAQLVGTVFEKRIITKF
jgi:SOS-response transcriptional repressor LexA